MKRILGVLVTVALLVSMTLPIASAAGTPTVSISSGEVEPGGTVTLTVSIQDNPGLAVYMLYIYYDTSVFEVDPDLDIESAGRFVAGGLIRNSIATAKANGRYEGTAGKDGVLALWYNGSGVNTTTDGQMLTVTMKAKTNAANGNYAISLGYSEADTINQDREKVALQTISGTVKVSGGSGTTPPEQTEESTTQPETPRFPDAVGHWAQAYIEKAAELGLILGNEYGMYMPDKTMTRAECVTILWRACGSPTPTKAATFTDLDPNQKWYHEAVAWAAETGVVKGTGDGTTFSPNDNVNRDQLATILHRMAGSPTGMESMLTSVYDAQFIDSGAIASWAKSGLYWTVFQEIYCGVNSEYVGNTLAPEAPALRSQIAVMIVRYLEDQGGI